jgi:hypothetical protein
MRHRDADAHQGSGKKPEPFFLFSSAIIEAAMIGLSRSELGRRRGRSPSVRCDTLLTRCEAYCDA